MNGDWLECVVEELAAPVKNALVGGPFGSDLVSKDYVPEGVPVIRGENLTHGKWIGGDFVYVSDEKARRLAANLARPGDLIFTQRGTLGQVGIVPEGPFVEYLVSQSQMKLTPDPAKVDVHFLYYVFRSEDQLSYIRSSAIQTGVPHTNLSILRSTPVLLPPLAEQREITGILGALDDKIALNRQMNATLEGIARALFQSWFVDFDPVRAKAEGRTPDAMDAETAALFPASFEDSPLGPIPSGWRVGTVGEIAQNFDAKRVPLSRQQREQRPGSYPYYGAASVMDYVDDWLFEGTHLLFAEDGSVKDDNGSPVLQYVWGQFWVNNHTHVLKGKNGVCTEHLYLYARNIQIDPYITGAVQPKISQANLNRIPLIIAPEAANRAFQVFIEPLFAQYRLIEEQTRTLAETRDALLPKLVSGALRVGETIVG